jgi:hypothetical protein
MIGNDLTEFSVEDGLISQVAAPHWAIPGFAIPIVRSQPGSNIAYVQRVDMDHRIVAFDIFDHASTLLPLTVEVSARRGADEIFAFVDPDGKAHAGTRKKLSPLVRAWISRIEAPLLRMSFARFCGEHEFAKEAAAQAVNLKAAEFKDRGQAVRWFLSAVVASELVDTLSLSHGRARAWHIMSLAERETISIQHRRSGRVSVHIPAYLLHRQDSQQKRYRKALSEVLDLAQTATRCDIDLETSIDQFETARAALDDRISEMSTRIADAGRQEARLALILRALISDPRVGAAIMNSHDDRAAFTRNSLTYLRHALGNEIDGENIELHVARCLPTIISGAYPLQKGRLLLDLAHHLGQYRHPAEVIRHAVLKSNARDVVSLQSAISRELARQRG